MAELERAEAPRAARHEVRDRLSAPRLHDDVGPSAGGLLENGLRANGFVTTTVGDGAKAVIVADHEDFDLLVLDLGLPVKDGSASCRRCAPAAAGCR